jgi:hypothetical protein
MRKIYGISLGLVIVGGLAGWLHWPSLFARSHHGGRPDPAAEPEQPNEASSSGASDEVVRLRAELQQKNALLLALASAQKKEEAKSPSQGGAMPTVDEKETVSRAVDILDERMFTAPRDQAKAAEMERALRELADTAQLSEAKVSSLYCGSTLCKITVSAQTNAALNRSITALGEHLPKTFGASAAYELSNGQSALYVAKANQDLDVQPAANAANDRQRPGVVMQEGGKATEIAGHQ